MLKDLKIKLFLPEDQIIRQGDTADNMYFLARGEWDVFVTNEYQAEKYTSTLKTASYFGEVALLKNCLRTASVFSKNYSTSAELKKDSFFSLIGRYPFIQKSMEDNIYDSYNDKWKKFIKRSIKNIDYFSYKISDKIIEEISYMFDTVSLKEEDFLFRAGIVCNEIYIISNGELDIYVHNNSKETYVETLYTGWSIGSYSALISENHTISAKARSDITLLKLSFSKLKGLRDKYEDLDKILHEYVNYLDENGLPYCDYKLFRNKKLSMSPLEKFKYGVKRIMRIVKSYRSCAFADLMQKVRDNIKSDKNKKESRRRSAIMRSVPLTPEERTQQILIDLCGRMDKLMVRIDKQDTMIEDLKVDLGDKIEKLKCYENSSENSSKSNMKHSISQKSKKSKKSNKWRNKNAKPSLIKMKTIAEKMINVCTLSSPQKSEVSESNRDILEAKPKISSIMASSAKLDNINNLK